MTKEPLSLSMITFFYNEEKDILKYLKTVTEKLQVTAKKYGFEYEIVMVDDGSTDASRKIVEDYIHRNPETKIILYSYPQNKGIGNALVEGLRLCKNDYIFWNDVDLHFDILDIGTILPHLNSHTIVSAYKNKVLYKEFGPWLISRTNYYLLKFFFCFQIKDFQFVQFYPQSFIKNVEIISRSSLIPCELLTRSKKQNFNIIQIPLTYCSPPHERKSKCMNLKNIYFTFRDILKLRIRLLQ